MPKALSAVPPSTEPLQWKPVEPVLLSQIGENFNAAFSNDGQRIIFISKNRPQHSWAQAYEMNLATKKERRITHQDGSVSQARYIANTGKIIYASTTDEIKENLQLLVNEINKSESATQIVAPPLFFADNSKSLPFELYESFSDGSGVQRLSKNKGLDGFPSPHVNGHLITFTSFRSGDGEVYQMNISQRTIARLTSMPGIDSQGTYSPDGKRLAWIHQSTTANSNAQLMLGTNIGRNATPLFKTAAVFAQPSWNSDSKTLIFSSNFENEKNFEIYTYNIEDKCLKKLTQNDAIDKEPSFSPDGKRILFTSDRSGKDQLYLMDYVVPAPCFPPEP